MTSRSRKERGFFAQSAIGLALTVVVALVVVAFVFGTVVPPGSMGVRQIRFGPKQGFSDTALEAGYHWNIPFYSAIHIIPQTVQLIDLGAPGTNEQGGTSEGGTLEIQTEDGSSVFVDISVLYRFYSQNGEGHGGPRELVTILTVSPNRWREQIDTDASNRLKVNLGTLSTSGFYDPEAREKQLKNAVREIQERLAPYGIAVDGILLRRYRYTEEIDNAIFQKNLQEQEQSLNRAKSRLAQATAVLKDVTAREDAKIQTLKVGGENKARVIRSEGDLFETKKRADGDLMIAQSHAEVQRLRAGALASSQGASIYVGKEIAPLLSSLRGGVVSDIDPYDLNQWIQRMGTDTGAR